uniref:Uncharacterized protein n=1 Tax=Peronospora matthiolae TaxID=2874970 RepID=A0AAV1TVY3_9STRA
MRKTGGDPAGVALLGVGRAVNADDRGPSIALFMFRKLTTEVGVLHLRKCQLTLQSSQTIQLLYEIADRGQAICDLLPRPIEFLPQIQNVYVKERPVGGQLVTLLLERIEFGLEGMDLSPQSFHLPFQAALILITGT